MRKKSVHKANEHFEWEVEQIAEFLTEAANLTDQSVSWAHDYAIIRLYRAFEDFVLTVLICAINNDTAQISEVTGINFPKHLTDEVCEYIIVGNGYFDFKGRDGLIKTIKRYVKDDHYLLVAVKKDRYRKALEQLSSLRNFAAHDSAQSKKSALIAVDLDRMSSSGSWLKKQDRYKVIAIKIKELAAEIAAAAPY